MLSVDGVVLSVDGVVLSAVGVVLSADGVVLLEDGTVLFAERVVTDVGMSSDGTVVTDGGMSSDGTVVTDGGMSSDGTVVSTVLSAVVSVQCADTPLTRSAQVRPVLPISRLRTADLLGGCGLFRVGFKGEDVLRTSHATPAGLCVEQVYTNHCREQ